MNAAADTQGVPEMPRHLRVVALAAGTFATLLGLITSAGWALHVPALVQLHPSFAPMVLNTALSFLLAGLGLLALAPGSRFGSRGSGVVIAALAALTLGAYLTSPGLKLDQLAFGGRFLDSGDPTRPLRMAPNTATAFLLIGLALALAGGRERSSRVFVVGGVAGIAVVSLSTVALLGYLLGVQPAFGWGRMIGMSPQTAVGLAVVGFAIAFVVGRPDLHAGHRRKRWVALLVGAAGVTTTLLLWQALVADHERALKNRVAAEALSVRVAVTSSLQSSVEALARLARRWEHRAAPIREEWEEDAGTYIKDFPAYLTVAWADPQAIVRWVAPRAGNETILGADLTAEGRRREAIEAVRKSNQATIFGPVELLLGGRGFGIVAPLSPQGGMGGFISTGFRGGHFLDSVLPADMRANHRISLLLAGESLGHATPEGPLSKDLRSRSAWLLLGRHWSVEVVPTASWASQQWSALPLGALCGGLIFSGLLAWSVLKTGEAHLIVLAQRQSEEALREAHGTLERAHQAAEETAERLQISEERYRGLVEAATDIIFRTNIAGEFTFVNAVAVRIMGYPERELLGMHFSELVRPDQRDEVRKWYEKQWGEKAVVTQHEFRAVAKDGREIWIEQTVQPVMQNGRMVAFQAIARDVTARKALEAERERLILELKATLAQVRTLSEMLPMCSGCRRIRDDEDGSWNQLESYLSKTKSGTQVSHDMCPECMRRLYPDYAMRVEARQRGEKP